MIVRITCSCGEVIELARPQAERLQNCPVCGAPLAKSTLQVEKPENYFDSPLLTCPVSLLAAWSFLVGVALAIAAACFLTVGALPNVGAAPAWPSSLLLGASGLWLAVGFALLAEWRWAICAAKALNAAGALAAIVAVGVAIARAIMFGPAILVASQTWITLGPAILCGPICLWFLLRLERQLPFSSGCFPKSPIRSRFALSNRFRDHHFD